MKGNKKVITHLNVLLGEELAAMDQYFLHSRMYEDWGMHRLYERISHEFDDEKGHASELIQRILFLEGTPDMSSRSAVNIGTDVVSMLESDLQLEYSVGKALKEAIKTCEEEQDYVTRELLETLLTDTESDHAYWLEQQLGLIKKIGLKNYIQSQMGDAD